MVLGGLSLLLAIGLQLLTYYVKAGSVLQTSMGFDELVHMFTRNISNHVISGNAILPLPLYESRSEPTIVDLYENYGYVFEPILPEIHGTGSITIQKVFLIPEGTMSLFMEGLPHVGKNSVSSIKGKISQRLVEHFQAFSGSKSISNIRCNDPTERSYLMNDFGFMTIRICKVSGMSRLPAALDENSKYHLVLLAGKEESDDLFVYTSSHMQFRYRRRTGSVGSYLRRGLHYIELVRQGRRGEMLKRSLLSEWSVSEADDDFISNGSSYLLQFDVASDFFLFDRMPIQVSAFALNSPQAVSVSMTTTDRKMHLLQCTDPRDQVLLTRSLSRADNVSIAPQIPIFSLSLCPNTGIRLPDSISPSTKIRFAIKWANPITGEPSLFFTGGKLFETAPALSFNLDDLDLDQSMLDLDLDLSGSGDDIFDFTQDDI